MDLEHIARQGQPLAMGCRRPSSYSGDASACIGEPSAKEGAAARANHHRGDSFFDGHAWVGYQTYVRLVRANAACRRPYAIHAPGDVYAAFAKLSECDRERFYTVHLDAQHRVCGVDLVSQGTVNSSIVSPREVYKAAILANASGIILIHNHPSGEVSPSADDRSITASLTEGGRILDIPVYDHVIIGSGGYFSFAEAGLL